MYSRISVSTIGPGQDESAAWAVALSSDSRKLPEGYEPLDRQCGGAIAAALKRKEFSANLGEVATLYPAQGPERLYLVGLGALAKFGASASPLRLAAAKLVRAAGGAGVSAVSLHALPALATLKPSAEARGGITEELLGRAIGDGLALGNFEFTQFKGAAKGENNSTKAHDGKPAGPKTLSVALEKALVAPAQRALAIGQSVNLTRGLAATPPNVANPAYLTTFCRKMAKPAGLRCNIINARKAAALKLNGLLAVGGAGSSPPALIVLEWDGTGQDVARQKGVPRSGGDRAALGSASRASIQGHGLRQSRRQAVAQDSDKPWHKDHAGPILLVGKAVTFDTGGYSIKPAESMVRMKYDKSGGAAVIGAMDAIARLKLPVHVVGLIPVAENMIAPTAYRPDDIIRMFNGVTVEVTNTDAEGRLILADALAYGCKMYQPRAVIDLATLTGGVVVALGPYCAGMFATDRELRSHLFDAADFTGERLWHLPLWDEHKQQMKGTHGDIANSAGRNASPIQGAAFLSYFVGKEGQPHSVGSGKPVAGEPAWVHLDIAGMSDVQKDSGLFATGPTGFGVRLLVRAVETWK